MALVHGIPGRDLRPDHRRGIALRLAIQVAAACLLIFCTQVAHAAGKKIIGNMPVSTSAAGVSLPVAIADIANAYPVVKWVPQARVARVAIDVASTAIVTGAAYMALDQMMDNAPAGATTYNTTINNFERVTRTYNWTSAICGSGNTYAGIGDPQGAVIAWCNSKNPLASARYYGGYTFTCNGTDSYGCRSYSVNWKTYNSSGSVYSSNSGGISRAADQYVFQGAEPLTEQDILDIINAVPVSAPLNIRDLFREDLSDLPGSPYGAPNQEVQASGHSPPTSAQWTDAQRIQLATDLKAGCNPAGDALVYEMCVFGREHGATNSPPVEQIDGGTQTDTEGTTQGNVTVNVTPDTPGGTFAEPSLEELTWPNVLQGFQTSLEAVPIANAWDGIANTWPAGGACPNGTLDLTGVGAGTHNLMAWACPLWEDTISPVLSVLMAVLWGVIGLTILMSA